MSDRNENERAYARMARASWIFASRGARRHAESARDWARADGLEALMRAREANERARRIERNERARKHRSKRAQPIYRAPARESTDLEIKARAFGTRTLRSVCALAVPGALIACPAWAALNGDPLALALWPVTYGYLAWDGWLHRPDHGDAVVITDLDDEADESKPSMFAKRRRASGLKPTPEESAIMHRIETWADRAAERKLQDVLPGAPVIDESGLIIPIDLAGLWTPAKLDGAADQLRALLGVPDEVRTQVKPGGTADRALLRVRTRMRELDLKWSPGLKGLGRYIDSADLVCVDIADRILVAGMSGAGKSVVLRVLMAEALNLPHTALVIIDLKVEGALWSHTARVESEVSEIEQLVGELVDEMRERETIMRAQSLDAWEPTEDRPRIVVVVDEGAELMAEVSDECMTGIRSLARRARSAEIVLWWATQKPTVTGKGAGLDSAISMQLTTQIALAVPSPTEARNVLGEDASAKGWHAEDLQKGGWALVREQGGDRAPDPMRVFFMTKEHVKALDGRKAWRRESASPTKPKSILAIALRLSEGLHGVSTARLAATLGKTDAEVHHIMRSTYGIHPEPNAFAMGNGEKARGYRRSALEAASKNEGD